MRTFIRCESRYMNESVHFHWNRKVSPNLECSCSIWTLHWWNVLWKSWQLESAFTGLWNRKRKMRRGRNGRNQTKKHCLPGLVCILYSSPLIRRVCQIICLPRFCPSYIEFAHGTSVPIYVSDFLIYSFSHLFTKNSSDRVDIFYFCTLLSRTKHCSFFS